MGGVSVGGGDVISMGGEVTPIGVGEAIEDGGESSAHGEGGEISSEIKPLGAVTSSMVDLGPPGEPAERVRILSILSAGL